MLRMITPNTPPTLVVCRQCVAKIKYGPGMSMDCRLCGGRLADPAALAAELPLQGQVLMAAEFTGDYEECEASRQPTADPAWASLVTSMMVGRPGMHRPVLDIDLPVAAVPSSTPGHFHLYIDKPMTWEAYRELLWALVRAGVIEVGYMNATVRRGHTAVRLPWVRKGEP